MNWEQLRANWPILVAMFGLLVSGVNLYGDVDEIKQSLPEPGSLKIIQFKIEKIEEALVEQRKERAEVMDLMRAGQHKVDSLIDVLIKEKEKEEREK